MQAGTSTCDEAEIGSGPGSGPAPRPRRMGAFMGLSSRRRSAIFQDGQKRNWPAKPRCEDDLERTIQSGASNVRMTLPDPEQPPLGRGVAAWPVAAGPIDTRTPYETLREPNDADLGTGLLRTGGSVALHWVCRWPPERRVGQPTAAGEGVTPWRLIETGWSSSEGGSAA